MNNKQTTPAAAAAAPAKVTGTKVSAAAASKFQPSAKLRRAINSNVSAAAKVGKQDVSVICEASVLIHELSIEVKTANKGKAKSDPTYTTFVDTIGDIFGIDKFDYSRTYRKVADAILSNYGGDPAKLAAAYLDTTPKRPSASGLVKFITPAKDESESKDGPVKVTFNLTSGKVTGAGQLTPKQLKELKTLFNGFILGYDGK